MPPLNESAESTPKLSATLPVSLKFENIEYRVSNEFESSWKDVKSWGQKFRRAARETVILHGISGRVHPGEMLGMLGPSGSGKTSLLQILAGRCPKHEGTITHNDVPFVKAMTRRTGLVTQDDILYAHLTVRETLVCAALLRLPRELSRKEKLHRVQDVITELGLERCQNTMVGGSYVRGVSGGERKRVSIGCEMLTDPSLLLLDEPTSGLDSTTALSMVRTLRNLAHGGKTIISTIHQPSSVIYHMFDKVLLLSDGQPMFYGKGSAALDYFESIGFHPTFATNPADFLLDLANGITHNLDDLHREVSLAIPRRRRAKDQAEERNCVKKLLKEAYVAHAVQESKSESMSRELKPKTYQEMEDCHDTVSRREWSTSWLQQFAILSRRALKERRHDSFSAPRILETLLVAIISGLIWWDSSDKIEDQVGLLFFSSTIWGFFPLFNSIFTFPQERDMLRKERASGMYRLSAYFLAQSTVDVPMELVLPFLYMIIVYWMGGLKANAIAFIATCAAVMSNVLVAQGLGLAIGAVCMNIKHASTLASVMMLTFLLAGGFYAKDISPALRWLKYVSFSYHGFKLELNSQFGADDVYPCSTGQCRVADIESVATVGLGGTLVSALAMLGLFVGFRLIAYIALRRTKI
ncbi:hypothetical protein Mapa_017668 [Marchantia paleacea]|nr:hypothetical protein Mapa_017668 [Marchantia paleacea]